MFIQQCVHDLLTTISTNEAVCTQAWSYNDEAFRITRTYLNNVSSTTICINNS